LNIDAGQSPRIKVGPERGGARWQKSDAANQPPQKFEEADLEARYSPVAQKPKFPVEIFNGERLGIVKGKTPQLRRNRERDFNKVIEVSVTTDIAQAANVVRF
jgi:hypothetical protein